MSPHKNFLDAACALLADPEVDSKVEELFKLTKSKKPHLLSEKMEKEFVPFQNGTGYYQTYQQKTYALGPIKVHCEKQDKTIASIEICDPQSGQILKVNRSVDGVETIETKSMIFELNLN